MQYFEDDEFVVVFLSHLGHVVYSDQKVKTSEISAGWKEVTIWLVNIISTEHDQLWGVIRSSMW